MFGEYLDQHPIESLLPDEMMPLFPSAENREAWEGISASDRREILDIAARYREIPYPMRKATDFLAFARSGSRAADEDPYFLRRRKLCVSALSCCTETDTSLDDVIDGIWCICEESSWVISAHNVNAIPGAPSALEYPLPDIRRPYIDLFAAQTGMILAIVSMMLERRLNEVSDILVSRVKEEIAQRILNPFLETDDFWWMGIRRQDLCNWTPWIVSNVMLTACTVGMDKSALARVLDRGCRMLDRWLRVVPADGGCDEGAGYWNMAGGALLDCLELLETVTRGEMTFWSEYRLQNILTFPVKAEMGNGWFANFADCDARPMLSGERLQYAGEKMQDHSLISLGIRMRGKLEDQLNDVPHFSRLLKMLFHPAGKVPQAIISPGVWLPDLQMRVVRKEGWTLCCKGGSNGDSHNHNDVGSFMLYLDGEPEIVDAGNMTYTAKTFSDQRYTLWNTRSAYHNVPLIGEYEQAAGKEFTAKEVHLKQNGLTMDLSRAYPAEAGIISLRREFDLQEGGLMIRDRVKLREARSVTWVFMLRNRPRLTGNSLVTEKMTIRWPGVAKPETEEIPITDSRMAKSFPGSLWRTRVVLPRVLKTDMCFLIEQNKD